MNSYVIVILFATTLLVISCYGSKHAPIHLYRLCLQACWKEHSICKKQCPGRSKDSRMERCNRKLKKCNAKCEKLLESQDADSTCSYNSCIKTCQDSHFRSIYLTPDQTS
ncbi:hypothetical protein LSAT2_008290 [Lamellibrachia satsuma]|nr:hypothetical protein LSAT2_008290 [Lamellibrachia satsuma]